MEPVVALLRGINVGGNRRVPMQPLRDTITALGHSSVRTYVQSGNVVFEPADDTAPTLLETSLETAIEESFGFPVHVVVRTRDELVSVAAGNPMSAEADEVPKSVHVVFLRDEPTAQAVAGLDPDRSPPDRFDVRGRDIYVHYPGGAARTKLTHDYFERALGITATARNWNTVTKLLSMLRTG